MCHASALQAECYKAFQISIQFKQHQSYFTVSRLFVLSSAVVVCGVDDENNELRQKAILDLKDKTRLIKLESFDSYRTRSYSKSKSNKSANASLSSNYGCNINR